MDALYYWRLCEQLTIVQAALLIVGEDPADSSEHVHNWPISERPAGYDAAVTFISFGLKSGALEGEILPCVEFNQYGNSEEEIEGTVEPHRSWVSVDLLRERLAKRGVTSGFFFPDGIGEPDFLDPQHERYAPKLAAAVRAWMAMDDGRASSGKSPKQSLVKWLREHAADFNLSDEDGKPNETGIEEVAKVANWRPTGGAPRTPSTNSNETVS